MWELPSALGTQSSTAGQTAETTLSTELPSQIKKLLEVTAAIPPGGDVRGFVEVKVGSNEILLPRAKVFLKRAGDNSIIPQSTVETSAIGRFNTPRQAPGLYRVCAEARS